MAFRGLRDVGTGGPEGPWLPLLANYAKVPLQTLKMPLQIDNIITYTFILITFTLEGNFAILFFHSSILNPCEGCSLSTFLIFQSKRCFDVAPSVSSSIRYV